MSNSVRTMADIARLAGVSVSTVSRALNYHPRIPPETRDRILQIANAFNYQVDAAARNLRLQRSDTIAALVPFGEGSHRKVSEPFYMEILSPIVTTLADAGYDLLISKVQASDTGWYERYVLSKRVAGLIVLGRKVEDQGIAALVEAAIPFVVWGPPLPDQPYVSVGSDGVSGGKQAVRHLVGLGRRRIGFVGGDVDETETQLRFAGYARGLAEAGLPLDHELVSYTEFTPESAEVAIATLLERAPDIDGLFVCSDHMAVAVMEALRQVGRNVPADVSVVGYDDVTLASHCTPPLTTLQQRLDEGGVRLARALVALLKGETPESAGLVPELVVRESCGAPRRAREGRSTPD